MSHLSIALLGTPQITLDDVPITAFRSTRALALLAYLATESSSAHPRTTLAALLWPEQDDTAAHRNLRLTLYRLRQALGDGKDSSFFEIYRETIRMRRCAEITVDVARFDALLDHCHDCDGHPAGETCDRCLEPLQEAVTLYRGDFLYGFALDDSEPFTEWADRRREFYQQRLLAGLDRLITYHRRRNAWEAVRACAQRQLELEPWLERAHRTLMEALARSGRRSAALAQYEHCHRMLANHLKVAPDWETRMLYERIRTMRDRSAPDIPSHPAPLIGRETECEEILALIDNPDCRLLTLLGPGGSGKTRLALYITQQQQAVGRYLNGVHFVTLSDVPGPDCLVPAIAHALGIPLHDLENPVAQIGRGLQDRELMLVLDAFEQVLENTEVLPALLRAVPSLRLLVTSREVLNVREEWLYPVSGLAIPPAGQQTDVASYSAVQLFADYARRVDPHFSVEHEPAEIARICRLVDGLPLALELAASWSKSLRCADIAGGIEQRLAFLSTTLSDMPARHRSMLAIFDQAWQRLGEAERAVFRRLGSFCNGFHYEAAGEIAGASHDMLRTFLDKSLLYRTARGRYALHELLRQYAQEQLAASPDELAAVSEAHARYYVGLLEQWQDDLFGGRQREAITAIAAEHDNIHYAWEWASGCGALSILAAGLQPLVLYYQLQGHYAEMRALLEKTVDVLDRRDRTPERDRSLAIGLSQLGWVCLQRGELDRAEDALRRSRSLYEALGSPPVPGPRTDPRLSLAGVRYRRGDYAGARALLEAARCANEQFDHKLNLQSVYCGFAKLAITEGDYEQARQAAAHAYVLAQQAEDRWFTAYCLVALGDTERLLGTYDRAREWYRKSYAIREDFSDASGMALVLGRLGELALQEQAWADAIRLYTESVALYRQVDDRYGLADALTGLGAAAIGAGLLADAQAYLLQAMQIAVALELTPLLLSIFTHIADLFLKRNQQRHVAVLLACASQHPVATGDTRARAQALQQRHRIVMDGRAPAAHDLLNLLVAELQAELADLNYAATS